ncbi:hypothetical protein [Beduinella massiliensis]|uniref:hypothetical protein n=1 Tax=Beduinella massiliensis TaxID=1852363 RepID=UPI0011AF6846
MEEQERCYWCGAPATSKEHVPPKCLFPETKDIKKIYGKDLRKDLITVPSCDEHNLRKSNDDEYLMVCLASRTGNNAEAYIHTCTKVRRARDRNPRLVVVESEDEIRTENTVFPVQWVNVDMIRLFHSFEAIARALYYYDFGVRFEGDCQIVTRLCFHPEAIESTVFNARACKMIEMEMPHWHTEVKGNNPAIFTYQFSPEDAMKVRTLCLTFYEKTQVFVALSRMTAEEIAFQREKNKNIIDAIFGDVLKPD